MILSNDGGSKWSEESFPSSHISDAFAIVVTVVTNQAERPLVQICAQKALQNRLGIKKLAKAFERLQTAKARVP